MVNCEYGRWYVVGGRSGKAGSGRQASGIGNQESECRAPTYCRLPSAFCLLLKEVMWHLAALSISNRQSKIGNPGGRFRCKLGSCLPVSPRQRSRHEDTTDSTVICPACSRRIVCVRP